MNSSRPTSIGEVEISTTRPKDHGPRKLAVMQIAAGGTAGLTESCLMYPLDVVKTRFQIQRNGGSNNYTSLRHCFSCMRRNEGLLSFYKGILPPLLVETPKRATKFFAFEQYKRFLMQFEEIPKPCMFCLAGCLAGSTEAFVVNPFEVVKVKLQTDRIAFSRQQSAYEAAREILKKQGFGMRGINKGLTTTMCSYGVSNTCYFGIYHNTKTFFFTNWEEVGILPRLLVGFVSGTCAAMANTPLDVIKSRIQGPQPQPGVQKYKSLLQTMKLIVREEGILALYRGMLPKMMKVGPGGSIMFLIFEHVFEFLQRTC